MIIREAEEEAFILGEEWDTAIPISYEKTDAGLEVHVFPQAAAVAEELVLRFGANPFSPQALAFLWQEMAPLLEKWGYADDRFRDRWGYVYRLQGGEAYIPRQGARRLTAADEARNGTTYDIAATIEDGRLVYGVKQEGRVLSVAVTHEPVRRRVQGRSIEVGVETVPSARGRGYATAALSALSAELLKRGYEVLYRCQRYNRASARTAEAAGLTRVGRYYYYVVRRLERK